MNRVCIEIKSEVNDIKKSWLFALADNATCLSVASYLVNEWTDFDTFFFLLKANVGNQDGSLLSYNLSRSVQVFQNGLSELLSSLQY